MNVGSILNGESPSENESNDVRPAMPLHQRHSINNLLNDAPGAKAIDSDISISEESATEREINEAMKEEEEKSSQANDARYHETSGQNNETSGQNNETSGQNNETPGQNNAKQNVKDKAPDQAQKQPQAQNSKTPANPKATVDSELQKIHRLKNAGSKPKRYEEPPIWAQQYQPPHQAPRDAAYKPAPAAAQGAVFDRESMYSADLECSITGVIPPQSTVRTIAEWLYANFVEISLENRQYVELELKFGTIVNKSSGSRLDIGVSSECIYTATADTRFEMGVHEAGWSDMREFLHELERAYVDEAKKNPSRPRRKFNTTESDTTDYFFHVSERNEKPQKIRISKDNQLVPPRYVGIQKKRLSDIYIHSPSSVYDLRLSLSLEMPVNEASVEPLMKKKPSLQRAKKRISFSHAPTVTRFDFTEVLLPKKTKNKFGKTVVENDRSHELELEMDTFQIFRGFDKIRDGSDTIRFEELVEIFLNNARCLNNRVTKLASK